MRMNAVIKKQSQMKRSLSVIALTLLIVFAHSSKETFAFQDHIIGLKNGMTLQGGMTARQEYRTEGTAKPGIAILIVDNGIRRVFTNNKNVISDELERPVVEEFELPQLGVQGDPELIALGPIIKKTPFDQYGRRMTQIVAPKGLATVQQAITRINPTYAVIRTKDTDRATYRKLEMRISTSSLPRRTLSRILRHAINPTIQNERLRIVDFYQQAERYRDAEAELGEIIKQWPELADDKKILISQLRQAWANQLVREIRNRVNVGQRELARMIIDRFPTREVADDILFNVGDIRDKLDEYDRRKVKIADEVTKAFERYKKGKTLEKKRADKIDRFVTEIESELCVENFARLAPFMTFAGEEDISTDESIAFALSGWVLGGDNVIENVEVAFSLYEARDYIKGYLAAENVVRRDEFLEKLKGTEGFAVEKISQIIQHLGPILESEEENETKGLYQIGVKWSPDEPPVKYWVQLPPNYNPHREYPCVLTLCGTGTSALQQIDWWAGNYNQEQKIRLGEAARHGYIVIAPEWKARGQSKYKYSLREHSKVLSSLRDAFRRFSINTDKVVITGHSMGGTAAWDIGFSHPDLWAGVIPIVATSDKYMEHYHSNPRYNLGAYFVHGEKEFDALRVNSRHFNNYLPKPHYDVMVVEYRGRGHEHFYEEITKLCEWIDLHQRNWTPRKFENVKSARPWDNFFWFIELAKVRENSVVLPEEYDLQKKKNELKAAKLTTISGEVLEVNKLRFKTTAVRNRILFSPDYIDFERPIFINGKVVEVEPDPIFLLEDVRRRGDRKRQFWQAKEM